MEKTKDNPDTAVYKIALLTRWQYAPLVEGKGQWTGNTLILTSPEFNKEIEVKTHYRRGVLRINITLDGTTNRCLT